MQGYRSVVEETSSSYSASAVFKNSILYPTTNLRFKLIEEKVEDLPTKYKIPTSTWGVYVATRIDRIYDNPEVSESLGGIAMGISEAAFKCGFRVPILPILKKLFRKMGISLGQMDLNGFIHTTASRPDLWRQK